MSQPYAVTEMFLSNLESTISWKEQQDFCLKRFSGMEKPWEAAYYIKMHFKNSKKNKKRERDQSLPQNVQFYFYPISCWVYINGLARAQDYKLRINNIRTSKTSRYSNYILFFSLTTLFLIVLNSPAFS